MAKKRTKSYSEPFRRDAGKLADQPDRTATDVARELGIHAGQICNWRTQFNQLFKNQFTVVDGTNYSKEEIAEIRRLKKEIAELKEERDFLKKRRHTSQRPASKVCPDSILSASVQGDDDSPGFCGFCGENPQCKVGNGY